MSSNQKLGILRTFLPALDYPVEKQFYKDIGFQIGWESEDMCVFNCGTYSFYLQKYYVKEWAENFMIFLEVDDVDHWHEHLELLNLNDNYHGIRITSPIDEDWGRVCRLITPSGVLWHFGTFAKAQ